MTTYLTFALSEAAAELGHPLHVQSASSSYNRVPLAPPIFSLSSRQASSWFFTRRLLPVKGCITGRNPLPAIDEHEKTEKEQLVVELKEKIEGAKALYYTDFTGLNVKRMTELRRRLRKADVEYVVIKNTLALRAVNESGSLASG